MSSSFVAWLTEHYHGLLSLGAFAGIFAVNFVGKQLLLLVPVFREADALNQASFNEKMKRPGYAANQQWNRKWGLIFYAVVFGLILPFTLTIEAQPWWKMVADIVIILMFYDFFYYLTHRFLFHDSRFLGGPLMWVHAVHHRQHNPCRADSSFIHPLEVAMGLGLYVASIFVLSLFLGRFHLATIIITWVAFSQINQHNHDLWRVDRFPFRYLAYMSKMHHNHHGKFTGGNFATISLLYDWMFGTMDYGKGFGRHVKP
jgi:sterol desaturase/sphingolipid hydroxylase (fatty acid hydroxylase superfamily)